MSQECFTNLNKWNKLRHLYFSACYVQSSILFHYMYNVLNIFKPYILHLELLIQYLHYLNITTLIWGSDDHHQSLNNCLALTCTLLLFSKSYLVYGNYL